METEDDLAAAMALSKGSNSEVAQRTATLLALPKPSKEQNLPILLKLLKNLVTEPSNEKFRSVKTANPKIQAAIMNVPEAKALMLACGFVEQEGMLVAGAGAEDTAREALDMLEEATASYALAQELTGHHGAVRCVCTLPDGSVVTGAMDNVVRIFPVGGGTPRCLTGHTRTAGVDGVLALSMVGSDCFASGARDGKILVWDVATMSTKTELTGHGESCDVTNAKSIGALAQLADSTIVSGGWDKTARIWSSSSSPQVLSGHTVAVNGICVLGSGEIVSASGDGTLRVWRNGTAVHVCEAGSPARSVCTVGDSNVVFASAHNDGKVRTWAGSAMSHSTPASTSYLFTVNYCPSRELLATGGDDGAVKLWNLALEHVQTMQHPMEIYGVFFSEVGDLITACGDQIARIWTKDPKRVASMAVLNDFESRVAAAMVATAASAGVPAAGAPNSAGGPWDFEFPVELTGGSKMTLRWNRGERTEDVANRFLQENGLGANHAPDVMAFVSRAQAQVGDGGAPAGGQTFSYPVEVADGRKLNISWTRGEDPMVVARRFAMENRIGAEELMDIVNFISQVQGTPPPAAPAPVAAPVAVSAEMVGTLTSMGFDEASAHAALQAAGGNVEVAIARLLG